MSFKYKIDLPIDSPERTLLHKEIILSKPFLKNIYKDWYSIFVEESKLLPKGKLIELGSGGGFLKELLPNVISSDILPLETNDMTFSALDMPFEDNSVSGIFMVDTFHHIPDSLIFLNESKRILKKGGKIIISEPANSLWGRFIYKNFHHEPFDPKGSWIIPSSGPLSGANGALPWIVFVRDNKKFNNIFPEFEIESVKYHTPLCYLVSGGVSFKKMVPNWSYSFFKYLDRSLSFCHKNFSMFMTVTIRKI